MTDTKNDEATAEANESDSPPRVIRNIHDIDELAKLRESAYGMAANNLNPEDVEDYMAIASAAARMESRKRVQRIPPKGGWDDPVADGRAPQETMGKTHLAIAEQRGDALSGALNLVTAIANCEFADQDSSDESEEAPVLKGFILKARDVAEDLRGSSCRFGTGERP